MPRPKYLGNQRCNFRWENDNWIHPLDKHSKKWGTTTFDGDIMYQWGGYFPNPNHMNHRGDIVNIFRDPYGNLHHYKYIGSDCPYIKDEDCYILQHKWRRYQQR